MEELSVASGNKKKSSCELNVSVNYSTAYMSFQASHSNRRGPYPGYPPG